MNCILRCSDAFNLRIRTAAKSRCILLQKHSTMTTATATAITTSVLTAFAAVLGTAFFAFLT
eukprot:15503-Heterococcus_DN1.PRE.2